MDNPKKLEEQARELEQKAKRIRLEQSHIAILNRDLELWFEKLENSASFEKRKQDKWKLCFLSMKYLGREQSCKHSYGGKDFMKFLQTEQNMGPTTVAYAVDKNDLFPEPTISAKRLIIFGFTFFIVPIETYEEFKELCYPQIADCLYGLHRKFDALEAVGETIFKDEKVNMTMQKDVDLVFREYETNFAPGYNPFVKGEIDRIDKEIEQLQEKRRKLLETDYRRIDIKNVPS